MKYTAKKSVIDNRVMSYTSDQTIAGTSVIIAKTGTPILGVFWAVKHPLAGGHKMDHGFALYSTLSAAKAHAEKMLAELGN